MMLDQVDLDAKESLGVRARLPGLDEALDVDAMMRRFKASFADTGSGRTVEDCVREKVHLDDNDCIVRYALQVREGLAGRAAPVLVTSRVFGDQAARMSYLAAALDLAAEAANSLETPRPQVPVVEFESLSAVAHAFPIDPHLPTLIQATDRSEMKRVLGHALLKGVGSNIAIERCDIEVAHYPRRHRCVLRYHVNPGPSHLVLYGKVASEDHGSLEQVTADRLRQELARGSGINVKLPRYLARVPELRLSVMEAVPGAPVIGALIKDKALGHPDGTSGSPRLEDALERCAGVLAAVHRADINSSRRRDPNDEIDALRNDLGAITALAPRLASQIQEMVEGVASRLKESEAMPLCFSHGDFTHSQILFDGSGTALIDFDDVCNAEPVLDLGQFCAYLLVAAHKAGRRSGTSNRLGIALRDRFLNCYVSQTGISDRGALVSRTLLYERLSLLRMALRGWRQLKPARVLAALSVLEAEEDPATG
jgi:hypothetical protein